MTDRRKKLLVFLISTFSLCLTLMTAFPARAEISGDYTYKINDGTAIITQYNGTETEVTIPSALDDIPVTELDISVFSNKETITKITIPEGVTSIGSWAFSGTGITAIVLPDSLKWLGYEAFLYCKSLQSISIPATNEAFVSLDGVLYSKDMAVLWAYPAARPASSCTIPSGVKIIADSAFVYSPLTEITLPEGVESIGENAFGNCKELERLDLPASLKSIQSGMGFTGCIGGCETLEGIHVSPDNTEFASLDGVLYNKSMTELLAYPLGKSGDSFTTPDGVITIGKHAFEQNMHLQSIILSDGVEVIDYDAFAFCENLKEIHLPDSLRSIGGAAFWFCKNLNNIVLPKGLTNLGKSAFHACMQLEGIIIPPGLTSIEQGTFSDCSKLANITIPPNVTSIGENVFWQCDDITILGEPGSYAQNYAKDNDIPFIIIAQSDSIVQSGQVTISVIHTKFAKDRSLVGYRHVAVQLDLQYEGDKQEPSDMFSRLMVLDGSGRLFDLWSFGSSHSNESEEWEYIADFKVPEDCGILRLVVLDPDHHTVAGLLDLPMEINPPKPLSNTSIASFTGEGFKAVVHGVTQRRYGGFNYPNPGWKYVYLDMTVTWSGSAKTVRDFISQFRYLQDGWKEWMMGSSHSGLQIVLNDKLPSVRIRVEIYAPENDREVILSFNGSVQTLTIQGEEFDPGVLSNADMDGYYSQAEWKVKVNGIRLEDQGDLASLPQGSHYMIADISIKNRSVLDLTLSKALPFAMTDEHGNELARAWFTGSDLTLDTVIKPAQSFEGRIAFVLPDGIMPTYLRANLSPLDAPVLIPVSQYLTE